MTSSKTTSEISGYVEETFLEPRFIVWCPAPNPLITGIKYICKRPECRIVGGCPKKCCNVFIRDIIVIETRLNKGCGYQGSVQGCSNKILEG